MRGISRLAEELLASEEGLCSMVLFSRTFWAITSHVGWESAATLFCLLIMFMFPKSAMEGLSPVGCSHFFMARQPLVGQDLLIVEASRSHSDTPHSVGLRWTCEWPVAGTSTWQHTTIPRGFEPAIPASERPKTHALDGVATGVGVYTLCAAELYFAHSHKLVKNLRMYFAKKYSLNVCTLFHHYLSISTCLTLQEHDDDDDDDDDDLFISLWSQGDKKFCVRLKPRFCITLTF